MESYVTKNTSNLKMSVGHEKIPKFNKRRAFNKPVGLGKKPKINKRRNYVYSGLCSICTGMKVQAYPEEK